MNATQAVTPNVPRRTNAGHLRYQTVNAMPPSKIVSQDASTRAEGSPRPRVALVSVLAWRSIDEVLRVKRRFRRGVVQLELVGTVDEPKGLLSRRASLENTEIFVSEFVP